LVLAVRDDMVKKLRAFILDDSGAEAVEYLLIALALLVPAAFIFQEMYTAVLDLMVTILRRLAG
jgi:Flp pilus assembly pilin Flp